MQDFFRGRTSVKYEIVHVQFSAPFMCNRTNVDDASVIGFDYKTFAINKPINCPALKFNKPFYSFYSFENYLNFCLPNNKLVSKKCPKWLLCIWYSNPSSVNFFSIIAQPALLIKISRRGSLFRTSAANLRTDFSEARSRWRIDTFLFPDSVMISSGRQTA